MGGALVAEEEKKVIKRLNSTDANEEPKSIFNHASRGAEGSRWCVRSAIEVFRGKERERGRLEGVVEEKLDLDQK